MTSKKHSTTPWHWAGGDAIFADDPVDSEGVCGHMVVEGDFTDDQFKADAEHIVHCVNAHDSLVVALDRIANLMAGTPAGRIAADALKKTSRP